MKTETAITRPLRLRARPTPVPIPHRPPAPLFRSGGEQALECSWYWSSTEFAQNDAWAQLFDDGDQGNAGKGNVLRVRAVRKVLI